MTGFFEFIGNAIELVFRLIGLGVMAVVGFFILGVLIFIGRCAWNLIEAIRECFDNSPEQPTMQEASSERLTPQSASSNRSTYNTQDKQQSSSQYAVLSDAPKISERPPGWLGLKHGDYKYEFQILKTKGEIRIYILAAPSYAKRKVTAHLTHRYFDSICKNHYVCCGSAPKNFNDAKEFARLWCRYTTLYVETGKDLFAS